MSVMQQLKTMASEGPSEFPRFSEGGAQPEQMAEMEGMMMANPIPGQSLTQSPDSRLPYETPPEFTDVQEFIDETFLRFTDEEGLPDLLDAMRSGLPVEYIVEKYLMQSFKKGEITPDLLMLCIEPSIYMLISLATYADIDPVLYPEDEMNDEDANAVHTDLYRKASKELLKGDSVEDLKTDDGRITVNDIQAPSNAPKSLLQRSKQAVNKLNQGSVA